MPVSVYDTLSEWARRTSSWAEMRFFSLVADEPHPANGLIYKLRYWPDLPASMRTANVYRALSVMSHRPVNRPWLLAHTRLQVAQLDLLLRRLQNQEAIEVIDATRYAPDKANAAQVGAGRVDGASADRPQAPAR
jgi:hypothetical protein